MAAKKKAKPAKINPEDFGFDESQWAKMDQRIRSWIVLNKELWKGLSKYQQDAVKASTDFAKNAKAASETAKETSKNMGYIVDVLSHTILIKLYVLIQKLNTIHLL